MQPHVLALTCSDCGASRGLTGDAEEDAYMLLDLVDFLREHERCAARVAMLPKADVPAPRAASDQQQPLTDH
jgi:hypothetical protein